MSSPVLIPLLAVAVEHEYREPHIVLSVLLVQTELLVEVPDLPGPQDLVLHKARHLAPEIPLEALAL